MGLRDLFRRRVVDPATDSWTRFSARARFISHVTETLGDPSQEFSVTEEAPDVQDMLIFEFPATEQRPRWTYLTAGLSLSPGRRELFPCELIAYSPEENARWTETLFRLAKLIAAAPPTEPFDPGHVVHVTGDDDEVEISFALAQPDEPEELLDFPNRTKRPEDERFLTPFSKGLSDACPRLILLAVSVKDR